MQKQSGHQIPSPEGFTPFHPWIRRALRSFLHGMNQPALNGAFSSGLLIVPLAPLLRAWDRPFRERMPLNSKTSTLFKALRPAIQLRDTAHAAMGAVFRHVWDWP
jgi:hypothetical protein